MGFFSQQQSAQPLSTPSSLSRSSTLSSDTVGTSSSSSVATIPSSTSSTSLRAFFASPKEYFAPAVVYSSSSGKSIRDAKLAAASDGLASGARGSGEILRPPPGFSTRKRANSAAALVPPLWVAPPPPIPRSGYRLADDGQTISGRRSRRGSAEENEEPYVTFVREHRRSRSATPTDRNRRPPSPKLASGKILSPLPELIGSGKSVMLADMESSRRSPTKMMRSPHLATVNLLEHAVESDEEAFEAPLSRGDLLAALDAKNQSSLSLSSTGSGGGDKAVVSVRSLQGRRSILRTHTDSVIASPASARSSPHSASTIRLAFPSTSPATLSDEDRSLPPLPPKTTFRPKSRRTLSLPFAPNLPATRAEGPMLPPPRPPPRQRSPFAVPASVLKAPSVSTSVSTSASMASLSTFSSWDFPTASNADSFVGRHRVLSHLDSYDLPQPRLASLVSPGPSRTRLTSSPSSLAHLSPPSAARLRMERSQTQPLISSRLGHAGAGSPSSPVGSQPTPLKRASTIAHHRPSAHQHSHVLSPLNGPGQLSYATSGSNNHRPHKVPKLRMPTSYSLQNCRELPPPPPPSGTLSPSGSMDGLSLVRTRSRDRRGSVSSAGSARDGGFRFPTPTPPPAETAALAGGMLRSSSAVSLAGLLNYARRPSVKDTEALRAEQHELARKAAVAAAIRAEEEDSDDDAPYLSYRTM